MTKPSGRGRHSFIQFYMNDWLAGTARMSRMVRSIYFDVCCYNWDKVQPVPPAELYLMLSDLEQGSALVEVLIESGQFQRDEKGGVFSPRAMAEAERAFAAWQAKSAGGRGGKPVPTKPEESSKSVPLEPEPEPEPDNPVGTAGAVDQIESLFKDGLAILVQAGKTEKQARSLIGKWRKDRMDGEVLTGLIECRTRSISDPVEWLTKRFTGPKRYVSASGYEYHGTPTEVIREAERRHDMSTYWAVKGDMEAPPSAPKPRKSKT